MVEVEWERAAESGLVINWDESGGPAVVPPERSGFGRTMIEQALTSDLRGKVALDFVPKGLRCRIDLPGEALADV